MKKTAFALSAVILFSSLVFNPIEISADNLGISAQSAVVIEQTTGKILYSKNENTKRPIASTTKIMTTLLTLESGNLDEQFTVNSDAIKVEGSSMGLKEGDIVTKRALCYGMLLPSGNDAANASAVKLAGSFEKFSFMMNNRAKEIGMTNTNFVTPSGLDAKNHFSTAYEMALLTREAMKNPEFCEICCQSNAKVCFGNPPYDRWLKNSNKLLNNYKGCIGVKTGFTDDAGRCLVSSAEKNGVRLICITLKAPDDWNDHKKMLDYGFSLLKKERLTAPEIQPEISLAGGFDDTVKIKVGDLPEVPFVQGDPQKVTSKVLLPQFVYAPVKSGDIVGTIKYFFDGREITDVPIIAIEVKEANIIEKKPSLFQNAKEKIKELFSKTT